MSRRGTALVERCVDVNRRLYGLRGDVDDTRLMARGRPVRVAAQPGQVVDLDLGQFWLTKGRDWQSRRRGEAAASGGPRRTITASGRLGWAGGGGHGRTTRGCVSQSTGVAQFRKARGGEIVLRAPARRTAMRSHGQGCVAAPADERLGAGKRLRGQRRFDTGPIASCVPRETPVGPSLRSPSVRRPWRAQTQRPRGLADRADQANQTDQTARRSNYAQGASRASMVSRARAPVRSRSTPASWSEVSERFAPARHAPATPLWPSSVRSPVRDVSSRATSL